MNPIQMLDMARLAAQHVMRTPPPPTPVPVPAAPVHILDGKREMRNPAAFFAAVRKITGPLNQVQVDTINRLLAGASHWTTAWLAYGLATAWHEARLKPIPEIGKGRGRYYGKPGRYGGQVPYGRGLVQLTHDDNYAWADGALGLNGSLLRNFDRALEPDIAARILVLGMETGAFTGRALRNTLTGEFGTHEQFVKSRPIINIMDRAELIAGYADRFQDAARAGRWED